MERERSPLPASVNDDRKVFVGGLHQSTQKSDLQKAFDQFRPVEVDIRYTQSGYSRNFGFITFETRELCEKAIQQMDNREVCGKPVTVVKARPMQDQPRGYKDGEYRGGGYRGRGDFGRGGRGRGGYSGSRGYDYYDRGYGRGGGYSRGGYDGYGDRPPRGYSEWRGYDLYERGGYRGGRGYGGGRGGGSRYEDRGYGDDRREGYRGDTYRSEGGYGDYGGGRDRGYEDREGGGGYGEDKYRGGADRSYERPSRRYRDEPYERGSPPPSRHYNGPSDDAEYRGGRY